MIQVETFTYNDDLLIKTYSDAGFLIERDGILYSEAVDPAWTQRTYTQTDIPIEQNEPIISDDEYAAAGRILMGVDQ